MKEQIQRIDEKLLAICTKISNVLQTWTGLTCYFVAKVGAGITAVRFVFKIADYWLPFLWEHSGVGNVVIGVLILLVLTVDVRSISQAEVFRSAEIKPACLKALMNFGARIFWLAFLLVDGVLLFRFQAAKGFWGTFWLLNILDCIGFSVGMVIMYYFVAVNPLPPGRNRIRAFVDKLNAGSRSKEPICAE
jgi:hypothetical protein